MAKKGKKKNTKGGARVAKRATTPPGTTESAATPGTAKSAATPKATSEAEVTRLEKAAIEHATEADLKAVEASPATAGMSLEAMIKRAAEAHVLLETQRRRTEEAQRAAETKKSKLEEAEKALADERDMLQLETTDLAERGAQLDEREKSVAKAAEDQVKREGLLVQRELDADAGFAQRNREALAGLEQEADEHRELFSSHRKKIAEERAAWEEELQQKRSELDAELAARREAAAIAVSQANAELEVGLEAQQAEQKRLRKEQRNLDASRELLEEDREAFDEKVAQHSARIIEDKDGEIDAIKERLESARAGRDELDKRLQAYEEAEQRFGNKTPEEVLKHQREQDKELKKLRKELGARPGPEASQRLEALESHQELWESDRLKLMTDLAEARQDATRKRIVVTEMEAVRDEKLTLESANALLREANAQLRSEVEGLVKGAEGKSSFPSCSAMDADNDLQSSRPTTDKINTLERFAHYVRHVMALDPETNKELHYSPKDVRCFLGGLAMSRLHLLQGISGTGKTSLPIAFARAIGAGVEVIEVQAGWRDRQDLVGHFNTFEKRFHESEFLQALYKASCPRWSDTPFIVVLDEMNLSHPEQYFADLLSAMEQEPKRQRLVLMPSGVVSPPKLLMDGGKKLRLPQNVWFVGTANHDETTKDFADKTYDRSHVMELPTKRVPFKREELRPIPPVSMKAMLEAFEQAREQYGDAAARAYRFLDESLSSILERRFRVGWGNRLERQMGDFVPVVIAAGGSVGEATDHILATKLLRKIRDRHDNRPEDLIALRDKVNEEWKKLDRDDEPARSTELLAHELRRIGHDDE